MPVLAAFLGVGLAAVIYTHARMRHEIEEARSREAALREATLRARLSALQAQINPHFLFNAFNALAELTHDDPVVAEQLVGDLAHLLRYTLRSSAEGVVPLSQELEAVDRYLRVERARLGDRLRVEIEVEPATRRTLVPGLVLQPLVENAIQHAIAPRTSGGTVRITIDQDESALRIIVADDGPGLPAAVRERLAEQLTDDVRVAEPPAAGTAGAGGGLFNVQQRLQLAYRGAAGVNVVVGAPGTTVEVRIPR